MAQQSYHLYRIKLIPPKQMDLFPNDLTSAGLFSLVLSEKPSIELYGDNVWHLGNLETFKDQFGAFAIGKTTRTTVEKYDDASGNFVEKEDEPGPYTWVVYDRSIGIIGIAQKARLAPHVSIIAKRLAQMLLATVLVKSRKFDVRVDAIADPIDFVGKLSSAYAIKTFRATFTGPNPVDADELFQKPLAVYCKSINASGGSAEVHGQSLDESTAVAVARATAATGNDASARIQPTQQWEQVRISLKGEEAAVSVDEAVPREQVAAAVREKYNSIRKQ
jgi:hypothetical protein